MNKNILLTPMLAVVMVFAAGCGDQQPTPPVSEPTATVQPAALTAQVATENDIAPVKPAPASTENAAMVKETYTFFFADKELMGMYRVAQEVTAASRQDLPLAALKLWMKGPVNEKLNNLVPPEVVVESLTSNNGLAYVSFSRELKNANLGSTGEMYLIDQIAQLMKQFGYDKTQILIEGKMEESILGHVTTNIPISPTDPEQYKWLDSGK